MKKKFGTLLAVTFAAAPAVAGPMHATHEANEGEKKVVKVEKKTNVEAAKPDPWAGRGGVPQFTPGLPKELREMQTKLVVDGAFAAFGVTTPRVLGTGSPACGNLQSKMPPSARRECKENQ